VTFELTTVGKTKVYASIVDQLLEGIRSGAFRPGSVLPAERELAVTFGVSRGSVREAIRVLEHSGVVDVRTGSGTFIAESGLSNATALRAHAALVGEESPLDVMVARRAIEPVCAEYAAVNRNPTDLQLLGASLEEQRALLERGESPSEVDLRFHSQLASSSRNPVLELLFHRIADIMRQGMWVRLKQRSLDHPGKQQLYLDQHAAILQALERRDSASAAQAMREHLDAVESGLLAELDE
jgi:GntR family transcriptional repressor for pyruvate dehydrogenase complex